MDANVGGAYNNRHSSNSSSSAVDLPGTGRVAPSPALRPSESDGQGYTRRRLSWSNAESGPSSPRLDLPLTQEPGASNLALSEDPFFSSSSRDSSLFPTSLPHASSTSLLSKVDSDVDTVPDDDETRLTQPKVDVRNRWSWDFSVEERSTGVTSRPRRYTTASPLQRTGTTIKNAFRHASMRVANVRGHRPSIRLPEGNEDSESDSTLDGIEETTQRDIGERVTYQSLSTIPLRGRALGFLGPTNPLRVRLYKLLIYPYAYFRLSFHSLSLYPGPPNQLYSL